MSFLTPGSRLGRFEISTVLGQGAMGVVYLANDPQIGRPVAIKTVRPGASRGEESANEIEERLRKEARLAGRLQHPNIVTIYDVGRDGDEYFIAMEYVDGKSLTRYLWRRTTCRSPPRSRSSGRPPRRWPTRTSAACCTATSSPATS
jgi:serine/threonine protein kinase